MTNRGHAYAERIAAGGWTVLDHLAARHRHSDRATWHRRLADGEVTLDGRTARADDVLAAGALLVWRRPPWREPDVPLSFAVLLRRGDLLAVAKPRGLPTLPGGGRFFEHTLLRRVARWVPGFAPVHRLGTGTSGVVLCARGHGTRSALAAAFRDGRVERVYRALARGVPAWSERVVDLPIGPVPHPRLGTVHAAAPGGRPARTRLAVLGTRADGTLVEARIETGRSHQVRIHLAVTGHPLAGDPLYVTGGVPAPGCAALPSAAGYWLHSERLVFPDPEDGRTVSVTCPPPPALR